MHWGSQWVDDLYWRGRPAWRLGAWVLPSALTLALTPQARAAGEPPGAAPENCPQVVQLQGDSSFAAAIGQALRRRGIATQPVAGCPAVHAQLQRHGTLLAITVHEEVRLGERIVADVATAVAVIESWVRSDISAPLLALPPPPPALPPAPLPPAAPAPPIQIVASRTRFAIDLAAEVGVDTDSTAWIGASLRGCLVVKTVCLGLAWRMAGDLPSLQPNGIFDQRLAADFLGTLAVPLRVGWMRFIPSIGLGAGWLRHTAHGTLGLNSVGTSIDQYQIQVLEVADSSVQDGGFRAELRLVSAVYLGAGTELALGIALCASFLNSPTPMIPVASSSYQPLAAAPWGLARIGFSLRWNIL